MNRYFYDLHVHSCLSPCAEDDMTVNNIAGMAALNHLQIVALTDHNSCGNCPAFFRAAAAQGIIPVAGMELTTAEEIHMICLFEELSDAMAFHAEVAKARTLVPNKVEIFGNQYYLDENDRILGTEPHLLPPATALSLEEGCALAAAHHGLCYPAHIDRPANGIVEILGTLPETPDFPCVEFADAANLEPYAARFPQIRHKRVIYSSDAHQLWNISEAEHAFSLPDEPYSGAFVRKQLFACLRGAL